jgi:Patatin phospholipase
MAALPFELPFILSNGPGVDRPSSSANQFSKAISSARTHTANNTDIYKRMNNLKADLYKALLKIPEDQLTDAERATRDSLADLPEITILQMIYQQKAYGAIPRITNSRRPRCASTGNAASRTPAGR